MRSDDYYFNIQKDLKKIDKDREFFIENNKSKFLKCQLITLKRLLEDAEDFACIRDDLRDEAIIRKHFDSLEVCSFMNNDAIKMVLSWKQFNLLNMKKDLLFLFVKKIEKAIEETKKDIRNLEQLKIEVV